MRRSIASVDRDDVMFGTKAMRRGTSYSARPSRASNASR
jgi:hypothetical protein